MVRLAFLTLLFFLVSAACYLAHDHFGHARTGALVVVSLTLSYLGIYVRDGLSSGLAYWGLAYAAFAIIFLGIGLIQSHAGCPTLIGDCYQRSLPSRLFEFKIFIGFLLLATNGLAIIAVLNNVRKLLSSSNQNHE
jgi:hypothetical protein